MKNADTPPSAGSDKTASARVDIEMIETDLSLNPDAPAHRHPFSMMPENFPEHDVSSPTRTTAIVEPRKRNVVDAVPPATHHPEYGQSSMRHSARTRLDGTHDMPVKRYDDGTTSRWSIAA